MVAGVFMLASSSAVIGSDDPQGSLPANPTDGADAQSSISFAIDNDSLVSDKDDEDYSGGFNLTFRGKGVVDQWTSLHKPLAWLDHQIGLDQWAGIGPNSAQIEYGVYIFTPEELGTSEPQPEDRPYASMVFIASSHDRYQASGEVSWNSTLTLGVLGLDLAKDLQEGLHSFRDVSNPSGWDNQISDGGEPTARYSLARQHLFYKNGSDFEIKTTAQGSVGYLTEASWGMSLRAGAIYTPWYSFNPELNSYGERPVPTDLGRASEHYFWAGFALTARAYNVFLQGQFRDSEVTYDSDDLNLAIVKAWAGYTYVFDNGYSLGYSIRAQTSELKDGDADRNYLWGTLSLSKFFY
jgi:hypothetical protein